MKKIAIISPSQLPIPAVYGGATETLIQNFIDVNEIQKIVYCDVISVYDKNAENLAKTYFFTNFLWIKKNFSDIINWNILRIINIINRILFNPQNIGISYEGYKIQKLLRNSNYDAVIVEGNGFHLHYIKNIISSDKLFFHIHSFYHCQTNEMNKYLMSIPDKIIAVSQFIANSLNNNLNIKFDKITVIKNCISDHFYTSTSKNLEKLSDKSNISIVFTGRIVEEKGILELLDALYIIRESNWQLFIIGSFGSDFGLHETKKTNKTNNIKDEVMKRVLLLEDKIKFLGYVDNKKVPELYSKFDFAVIPSICQDAAPLTIGEYLSVGLPVIGSDMGGIPEYLSTDSGIIVSYNENFVKNFASSLKQLIDNSELRKQMSINAKINANSFKQSHYYEQIIQEIN